MRISSIASLVIIVGATNIVFLEAQIPQPFSTPDEKEYCIFMRCVDALDYRKAQAIAEDAIRRDPMNPYYYELLGTVFSYQGDHDKAIEEYSKAIAKGSTRLSVYNNRGTEYRAKKDWSRAVTDFSIALQMDPDNATIYLARSLAYYGLEKLPKARADIEAALTYDVVNPSLLEEVGSVCAAFGDHELSIRCFTVSMHLGGESAPLYDCRGSQFASIYNWGHAITDYSKAIQLDPSNHAYYYNRALAYRSSYQYSKAIADLEQCYKHGGEKVAACELASILCVCPDNNVRDGQRALKFALEACRTTEFKDSSALDVLAAAYAEVGQWDDAIKWTTQALKLVPDEQIDSIRLHLELYRLHEPYREVVPIEPTHHVSASAAEAVLSGIAKGRTGNLTGAIMDLKRAIKLNPRLVSAHYSLAVAYSKQGNKPDAIKHFSYCLKHDPENLHALVGRADAYVCLEKSKEALDDAEAILILNNKQFEARCVRAWSLANLGATDEALEESYRLIEELPNSIAVLFVRGYCYRAAGRYSDAYNDLTQVIQQSPDNGDAYSQRAIVLTAMGKTDEAKKDLDECIRSTPHLRERTEAQMRSISDEN